LSGSDPRGRSGPDPDGGGRAALLGRLGLDIADDLLGLALTHRSYAYENGGLPTNERLEFLGDSVLGVIITDALYRRHPDLPEGQLAKLRASIVNMHALAGVGRALGVGELLLLGRGEELTRGREKPSIVSDAVEALIGAMYLQHGLEPVRAAVLRIFADLLTSAPRLGAGLDWKTSLQELSATVGAGVPEYRIEEDGPDHDKTFTAQALIAGAVLGHGTGHTNKEAEQQAASAAYEALKARADDAGQDGDGAAGPSANGDAAAGPSTDGDGASGPTAAGDGSTGIAAGSAGTTTGAAPPGA
jgi:ribonuclease-3